MTHTQMTASEIRTAASELNVDITGLDLRKKADKEKAIVMIEATQPTPIVDMENADDLQQIACSLTSAIDDNPLWLFRSCELPEMVEERTVSVIAQEIVEEVKSNDKYWTDYMAAYDNAIAKLAPTPVVVTEAKEPEIEFKQETIGLVFVLLLTVFAEALMGSIEMVRKSEYAQRKAKSFKDMVRALPKVPRYVKVYGFGKFSRA